MNDQTVIKANNDSLSLPPGTTLTLVSKNGEVLNEGKDLITQIFTAITDEVVAQIFCEARPISEGTFRP
ncbi:hypothetical protein C2869_16310 [Saccharobesus litoralis]|uniref:Uncharacterized protein n=1 Tax=Saccharobesus litoralis TaxID=2172099 RepID=A0A2S0VUJ6_9ALTE|nr:hypothetical protein [Saccharobesus litoralis]AWB67891.1 hypothetical protein C2869_16310 [Saccharobesus litoralis]